VPRPSAVHATRGKRSGRPPSPVSVILLLAEAGAGDARMRRRRGNPRFAGLLRSRRGAAARRGQRPELSPPQAAARGSRGRGAVVVTVMGQGRKREAGVRGRGAAASIAAMGTRAFVNGYGSKSSDFGGGRGATGAQ
jgi:hypothetical protein